MSQQLLPQEHREQPSWHILSGVPEPYWCRGRDIQRTKAQGDTDPSPPPYAASGSSSVSSPTASDTAQSPLLNKHTPPKHKAHLCAEPLPITQGLGEGQDRTPAALIPRTPHGLNPKAIRARGAGVNLSAQAAGRAVPCPGHHHPLNIFLCEVMLSERDCWLPASLVDAGWKSRGHKHLPPQHLAVHTSAHPSSHPLPTAELF